MKIVITGATAGIGLSCTRALCEEGHSVIGIARSEQTLNELTSELENFTGIACDIADDASVATLGSRIADAAGDRTVDVLINNAGYAAAGPVELVAIEEWKAQFAVNVFGTVAVTQVVLPFLRSSTRARIINVSSVAGRVYLPFFAPYYSSKHAIECISDVLRMELQGVQPETIVDTILEAIRAEKPKNRYVVPKLPPLAFIALAKLLPSRMTDQLVRRIVKL